MMYWFGNGMGGWGYALMTVSTVVFWGLVITGSVLLIRRTTRQDESPRETPERMLAERFARGEIDPEEYQLRLDILRGRAPSATG